MKNMLVISAILLVVLLLFPLVALTDGGSGTLTPDETEDTAIAAQAGADTSLVYYSSFRVLDKTTGKITEMPTSDYIRGVIAGEMPALYENEALKAQAVAAYTYACWKRETAGERDYDITNDSATDQCYITDANARENWGENADEYIRKINEAVAATRGCLVTYGGKTAMTVYHAISGGRTEDCADVWGSSYPYLVPVDSVGDRLAPQYLSTAEFTPDRLSSAMSGLSPASGEASGWFSGSEVSDSGTVKKIRFCGKELTGAQVAKALSLRSARFEVSFSADKFSFTVRGYGHGVGMSQNGANYMAKQGSSFTEILSWYYTGCKVERLSGK